MLVGKTGRESNNGSIVLLGHRFAPGYVNKLLDPYDLHSAGPKEEKIYFSLRANGNQIPEKGR